MSFRRKVWRLVLGAGVALGTAQAPTAQDASRYFTVQHPDRFAIDWKAFYAVADRRTAATREALPHTLDVPYGAHAKQRLDVYRPAAAEGPGPVFVFLHGGGFREGDRAHYGYVARPLADRGIVTIVASYRLTPEFTYPAQVEDAQRILQWTYEHASEHGGDPARIHVGGHSAGAILSASVGLRTDWLDDAGLPRNLIKGCVPVSGPYDLREERSLENYLPDPTRRAEASPILHVESAPVVHTLVAVGSVERYVESSRLLVEQVRAAGGSATLLVLDGMPHDETALAMADADGLLVQAMVEMMAGR